MLWRHSFPLRVGHHFWLLVNEQEDIVESLHGLSTRFNVDNYGNLHPRCVGTWRSVLKVYFISPPPNRGGTTDYFPLIEHQLCSRSDYTVGRKIHLIKLVRVACRASASLWRGQHMVEDITPPNALPPTYFVSFRVAVRKAYSRAHRDYKCAKKPRHISIWLWGSRTSIPEVFGSV